MKPELLPDGPAVVLLLTAEDGLADTVVPRLTEMDADLFRVHVLTGILDASGESPVTLTPEGLLMLERAIVATGAKLVVIDPLVFYLGAGVDMHRANEVRPAMAAMAAMAERHECAIVAVRHLNKATGGPAAYRGQGSIDFYAAARSVLHIGRDPDDPARSIMAHAKHNLSAPGPSLAYSVQGGQFGWIGEVDVSADDLAAAVRTEGAMREAHEFLLEVFKDGKRRPSVDVLAEAGQEGIASKTLRRAYKELGGKPEREGIEGKQGGGRWMWPAVVKPPDPPEKGLGALEPSLEHLNPDGTPTTTEKRRPDAENSPPGLDGHAPSDVLLPGPHVHQNIEDEPEYSGGTCDCGGTWRRINRDVYRCSGCQDVVDLRAAS